MDKKILKAKDIAQLWGITPRRVNQLCTAGFINGAYKEGRYWLIPSDTTKPEILRNKQTPPLSGRLLPCPVGITSYKEVSKECYYVDKTLLIKDIIDDHSKVYLFTRPRRFGKTLTMDMIRTYFEKTSTDTSIYFSDKKIWDCGDAYKQLQGTYPVIFLSFKDAHQTNWTDMYRSLCFTLKEEFLRHIELLSSKAINEYDKKYIHNLINDVADSTDYQFALGKLSSLLATHYNQKVIIIIDEYDTPIQQGHLYHYYNEVVGFMRNLFSSALKDNENLEFGILTGILRIAKESLFSGLNNLVVNTILDDKYSEYFGFTVNDISNMAAYYGMAEKLSEIKEWYDGYLFGNTEIYNPWSVINYFNNNCKPKAFWSRTSGNEIIGELVRSSDKEVYESLSLLLQGKEVQSIINTDIIYPEVNADSDTIYSFLLVAGYLRATSVISEFNDNPICSLKLPNREIKSVFQQVILLFSLTLCKNISCSLPVLLTLQTKIFITELFSECWQYSQTDIISLPTENPAKGVLIYSLSQKINPNWAILLNLKPEKTFQIPNLLILRQVRYNRSKAKNILPTWNIMVSKKLDFLGLHSVANVLQLNMKKYNSIHKTHPLIILKN